MLANGEWTKLLPFDPSSDLIAAGLSPFAPETQAIRASQLVLERIHRLVDEKKSFSFETTLSGRSYRQQIPQWSQAGFRVTLFFLWLPSADLAVERVAVRVQQGGHNIPEPDIRRRFTRGLQNLFNLYLPCVDDAYVYNGSLLPPQLVWQREAGSEMIIDQATWLAVTHTAKESQ
ncbi:MAG: Zeta toxin family protein [Planctomycetota bacterium]|nr:Zeta toxin family protein [Planctomycetota bacterium]